MRFCVVNSVTILTLAASVGAVSAAPLSSLPRAPVAAGVLMVDERVPASVRAELEAMGHNVRPTRGIGLPHALRIEYDADGRPTRFVGAADSRGAGTAVGLDQTLGR